jgi:hypothetical protein
MSAKQCFTAQVMLWRVDTMADVNLDEGLTLSAQTFLTDAANAAAVTVCYTRSFRKRTIQVNVAQPKLKLFCVHFRFVDCSEWRRNPTKMCVSRRRHLHRFTGRSPEVRRLLTPCMPTFMEVLPSLMCLRRSRRHVCV